VDEHSKARLAPPLHARVALGWSFRVLYGGHGMVDGTGNGRAGFELRVAERGDNGDQTGNSDAMRNVHSNSSVRSSGLKIVFKNRLSWTEESNPFAVGAGESR
jgi:hypothetical protein